eukprot:COSAG01_NODE_3343_length_6226_cov_7.362272_5_plen_86_part_00
MLAPWLQKSGFTGMFVLLNRQVQSIGPPSYHMATVSCNSTSVLQLSEWWPSRQLVGRQEPAGNRTRWYGARAQRRAFTSVDIWYD